MNNGADATTAPPPAQSNDPDPWAVCFISVALMVGAAVGEIQRWDMNDTWWVCTIKRVPYIAWLFGFGLGVGGLSRAGVLGVSESDVTDIDPRMLLQIFLPLIIFESSFTVDTHVFSKVLKPCMILSIPGVIVTIAFIAAFAKYTFGYSWSWAESLLFASIVTPTDPAAMTAIVTSFKTDSTLKCLMEVESLFSDGTAFVFYFIFRDAALHEGHDWDKSVIVTFLRVCLLGPLLGLSIGVLLVILLAKISNNPTAEVSATVSTTYFLFFVCEVYGKTSGVLALVVMGLFLSSRRFCISPEVENFHSQFWRFAVYTTNTLVAAFAGLVLVTRYTASAKDLLLLLNLYLASNVVRFCTLFFLLPLMSSNTFEVDVAQGVMLSWCSFRGAVSLILGLVMTNTTDASFNEDVGVRMLFMISGFAMCTLVVNGVLSQPLLLFLGLDKIPQKRKSAMATAHKKIMSDMQNSFHSFSLDEDLVGVNWGLVRELIDESLMPNPYRNVEAFPCAKYNACEEARVTFINALKANFYKQYEEGALSWEILRRLTSSADEVIEIPYEPLTCENVTGLANGTCKDATAMESQLKRIPFFSNYVLLPALQSRCETALAFVRAQGYAMDAINLIPSRRIAKDMIEINNEQLMLARQVLVVYNEKFPTVTSAILTRFVTKLIINNARKTVRQVLFSGFMEAEDADLLFGLLDSTLRRLNRLNMVSTISSRVVDIKSIMLDSDVARGITENDQLEEFTSGWFMVVYEPDNKLDPEMLHYVIDGLVYDPTTNELHGPRSFVLSIRSFTAQQHPEGIARTAVTCACVPQAVFRMFKDTPLIFKSLLFYYCVHSSRRLLHSAEPFNRLTYSEMVAHCTKGELIIHQIESEFQEQDKLGLNEELLEATGEFLRSPDRRRMSISGLEQRGPVFQLRRKFGPNACVVLLIHGTVEAETTTSVGPCVLHTSFGDANYVVRSADGAYVFKIPPCEGLDFSLISRLANARAHASSQGSPTSTAASVSSRASSKKSATSRTSASPSSPSWNARKSIAPIVENMLIAHNSINKLRKSPNMRTSKTSEPDTIVSEYL